MDASIELEREGARSQTVQKQRSEPVNQMLEVGQERRYEQAHIPVEYLANLSWRGRHQFAAVPGETNFFWPRASRRLRSRDSFVKM
jgi:hypothetical protein